MVRQVTMQHFLLEETPATGQFGHLQLVSSMECMKANILMLVMNSAPHCSLCLTLLRFPPKFLGLYSIDYFYKKAINSMHSGHLVHTTCS